MCRALLVANNPTPLTFRVMSVYFGQKLIFWFLQIHFVILRNTCFQFTSFRMLSVAHSGSSGSWSPCNFDQEPLQSVSNYTYFNLHKSVLQFREILVLNLKKYTVVAKIPLAPSGCCQWHTLAVQGLGHRVIYFNSLSNPCQIIHISICTNLFCSFEKYLF